MATRKKKALGDDPLSWLSGNTAEEEKQVPNKSKATEKVEGKAAPKAKNTVPDEKTPEDAADSKIGSSSGSEKIVLELIVAIDDAKKLHEGLNLCLAKKNDVIIDASSVQMIDTAMLQLLTAFVQKLKGQGAKVTWVKPSDEFVNRAAFLDLKEHMDLH